MKAKVIGYDEHNDCSICRTDDGDELKIDLCVSGDIGLLTGPQLIGRDVEYERTHPYVSIAHGVRLIPISDGGAA